jgi:tRNA G18 (ribose-2'-O)-methylase SpoU
MNINSHTFFTENKYSLPENINLPIIAVCRLATPENCGNIIRLADTIGCKQVFFTRWGDQISDQKIRKTAGKSFNRITFQFVEEDELFSFFPGGYEVIGLETASGSVNLFKTTLPQSMVLLAGSEKLGIPEKILSECDKIVHIPLTGECTSLNVSHAVGIALFEWLRQVMG